MPKPVRPAIRTTVRPTSRTDVRSPVILRRSSAHLPPRGVPGPDGIISLADPVLGLRAFPISCRDSTGPPSNPRRARCCVTAAGRTPVSGACSCCRAIGWSRTFGRAPGGCAIRSDGCSCAANLQRCSDCRVWPACRRSHSGSTRMRLPSATSKAKRSAASSRSARTAATSPHSSDCCRRSMRAESSISTPAVPATF